jgi:hypothetical protein
LHAYIISLNSDFRKQVLSVIFDLKEARFRAAGQSFDMLSPEADRMPCNDSKQALLGLIDSANSTANEFTPGLVLKYLIPDSRRCRYV